MNHPERKNDERPTPLRGAGPAPTDSEGTAGGASGSVEKRDPKHGLAKKFDIGADNAKEIPKEHAR